LTHLYQVLVFSPLRNVLETHFRSARVTITDTNKYFSELLFYVVMSSA